MKILIDLTQIPVQKVGVGVYALNLIYKIRELDKTNYYFLLVQDDDKELHFLASRNFSVIKIKSKYFRHLILRFFLEQFYIPYLVLKLKVSIVHSLHYSFPLFAPAKKAVTIHDMTFYKFPKSHIFIKRCYFSFFITLASKFTNIIITDSKSTSDDFFHRFKTDKRKIFIVHLGKNDAFKDDLGISRINSVNIKYGILKGYFLYLGTIEPRKNIKNIILAFDKYLKENKLYQLVIAGKKGWFFEDVFSLVDRLHLLENVIFTGFIEEEDKPYLIAGAKIFIYPSIYEGFGIPVLEALACGIPTITSNVSSLPEVAGDAALLVPPKDIEEIYLAIRRLIEDKELYENLKRRSIEQAKKFSWEKTAFETIKAYNSLR